MIKPRGAVVNSDKEMGVVKPNLGRRKLLASLGAGVVLGAAAGFTGGRLTAPTPPPIAEELNRVIAERKLELSHAKAALKTYVPGGWKDEFIMISSGGHGGQVLIIGVPSMRIIKVVAVFTPEPWQGYGYGDVKTMKLLQKGSNGIRLLTLGDTHHPEISKTRGEYDGEWAFIGDKLNARVASISLKDFETKDIVKIPNTQTQHGGACTTPNSEYVGCGSQFPAPWEPGKGYKPGVTYVKLTETNYVEKFRGRRHSSPLTEPVESLTSRGVSR
jgi:nitrous-oxide reductase